MVNKTHKTTKKKKQHSTRKNLLAPRSTTKPKTTYPPLPPSSPYAFKPGTHVEISSDEDGFRGSWYTGTVIRRCSDTRSYLVRYHSIFKDDAGKVPLDQKFDCGQLRPVPPEEKVGI